MPELPEVETTRLGILPHILEKKVVHVLVREPRLRWPVPDGLSQSMTGQTIEGIARRGKYLLFTTATGRLMVHLGMSGSLRIVRDETPPRKHDHVDVGFSDGTILRFHDPRRFGSVFWLHNDDSHPLLDGLGPEPLSADFNGDYLYAASRKRQVAIKLFIMNSKIVVGCGNIYANEALYLAGIRPNVSVKKISRSRLAQLAGHIKEVLANAIEAGGTTLRDFVREDGQPGYFKQSLNVYGRGDQPCFGCGRPLKEIRMGDRTTVYCLSCQK